jgi:hypothetical protein
MRQPTDEELIRAWRTALRIGIVGPDENPSDSVAKALAGERAQRTQARKST